MKFIKSLLTIVAVLGITTITTAQDTKKQPKNINYSIGAGFAVINDYQGGTDYRALPFITFSADWNSGQYVRLLGLSLEANLSKNRKFEFGPKLSFNPNRTDEIEENDVANLEEIDFGVSAGAFFKYNFNNFDVKVDYTHDISGVSEGGLGSLEFGYTLKKKRLITRFAATTTYGTENYMDTYFGVNPNNIGTSLLPYYELEGGIKDVGVSVNPMYVLNKNWMLFSQIQYSKLLGDATDSPLVNLGNENQFSAAFGVAYRF